MREGILAVCSFNQHVLSICSLAICSHDSGWGKSKIICLWKREENRMVNLGKDMVFRRDKGGDGGGKVRETGGELGKSESVKYLIIIMVL